MAIRNFNNTSVPQTLTSLLPATGGGSTSPQVSSTSSYPTPPFTLALEQGTINQELCLCTAIPNSTTFTVVRGYNMPGWTPIEHQEGALLSHDTGAIDYQEANAFVNLLTNAGDLVVGTAGGAGTAVRVPVGSTNGNFLMQDNTQAAGVSWQPAVAPGICAHTAASTAPVGWLKRDGSSYPTATYPNLFAQIGYTAGGAGANFNVPNDIGRFDIGAGTGGPGGTYNILTAGGVFQVTLVGSNLPPHAHPLSLSDPGHGHPTYLDGYGSEFEFLYTIPGLGSQILLVAGEGGLNISWSAANSIKANTTGISGTATSQGGTLSQPFGTVPPYRALTPIIKY